LIKKPKIILAEDSPAMARFLNFKLEKKGYEVLHFASGMGVAEAIEKEKPALVILDIMMPSKDGIQVLIEIRENPANEDLPVFLMSAKNIEDFDQLKVVSLATAVILKPFSTDELLEKIEKFIT
jgi:DNA-binding response OmpR family regulator